VETVAANIACGESDRKWRPSAESIRSFLLARTFEMQQSNSQSPNPFNQLFWLAVMPMWIERIAVGVSQPQYYMSQ